MPKAVVLKNDFTALNRFVRGLTGPAYIVKIGIMGEKSARTKGAVTNAELGLVHELGSFKRGIPPRSFLRMPLHQKQNDILEEARQGMDKKLEKGDMVGVLKGLGVACENAVQDAFGSRGFGTWAPDKPATVARKGSDAPLIDRGELRKAITSKVERKGG